MVLEGVLAVCKAYEALNKEARALLAVAMRGGLKKRSERVPVSLFALADVDEWLDTVYNNVSEAVDEVVDVRERIDDFMGGIMEG